MHTSHDKMVIRFVAGTHGGWTAQCPRCPSLVVRQHWALVMAHAERHQAMHALMDHYNTTQPPHTFVYTRGGVVGEPS